MRISLLVTLFFLAGSIYAFRKSFHEFKAGLPLNMMENPITNLGMPTESHHATSRSYVDAAAASSGFFRLEIDFAKSEVVCNATEVVVTDLTQVTCSIYLRTSSNTVGAAPIDLGVLDVNAVQGDASPLAIAQPVMWDDYHRTFDFTLDAPLSLGTVAIYVTYYNLLMLGNPSATFSVVRGPIHIVHKDSCEASGLDARCAVFCTDALGFAAGSSQEEADLEMIQFQEHGEDILLPSIVWNATNQVFEFVVAPFGVCDLIWEVGVIRSGETTGVQTAAIQSISLPSPNTWTLVQNALFPDWWIRTIAYRGAIYNFGCWACSGSLGGVRRYLPVSNSWSVTDSETSPLQKQMAVGVVNEKAYLISGIEHYSGNLTKRVIVFNLRTGTFVGDGPPSPVGVRRGCAASLGTDIYFNAGTNTFVLHTEPTLVWGAQQDSSGTNADTRPCLSSNGYIFQWSGTSLYRFDPSIQVGMGQWQEVASGGLVHDSGGSLILQGMPCFFGGNSGSTAETQTRTTECWDGNALIQPIPDTPMPGVVDGGGQCHGVGVGVVRLPGGGELLISGEGYDYVLAAGQDETRVFYLPP